MKSTSIPGTLLFTALLACLPAALSVSQAQETVLPQLGSSAGELITPAQEQQYGAYTLHQLRQMDYVIDDPLIDTWLQTMGHRLGASSDNPKQPYTFFMMRDRQINAFATLGGYIGMNAGLVLTARTEDEVAGVVGHEIAHVTQKHVLRSVERAKKDQIPIMLAAIGMIVAAQSASSGNSADNASMAAMVGSQALMMQRQIDYTRSNESEADRIGIQTLYRSGYSPDALADFFVRMESTRRGNSGGYKAPDYLSSHPVTTIRISEARDRAYKIKQNRTDLGLENAAGNNPLLPDFAQPGKADRNSGKLGDDFPWAKERLRVLSAATPSIALSEYRKGIDGYERNLSDAQKYGMALAYLENNQAGSAESLLSGLAKSRPDNLWIGIAHAESAHALKANELAQARFEQLLTRFPNNRAVILAYAESLLKQNDKTAALRAQEILRTLSSDSAEDVVFQRSFARAFELSGNTLRAAESYAEVAYLNGRVDDAINQLTVLMKNDDLDYYQRARIEARIAELRPISLELERQGIRAEEQGR
jgi:predicted Zn-dependent protease